MLVPGLVYLLTIWKAVPDSWSDWKRRLLAVALSPVMGLWIFANAIPGELIRDAFVLGVGLPVVLGLVVRLPPRGIEGRFRRRHKS